MCSICEPGIFDACGSQITVDLTILKLMAIIIFQLCKLFGSHTML